MEELILARHGESVFSAAGRLNGDPAVSCPLSPDGVVQARALGERLEGVAVDLWVATQFERTVQTVAEARGEAPGAPTVIAELNDPRYGRYEGAMLEEYRRWSYAAPSREQAPGGGESRAEVVERYIVGLQELLDRSERRIVAVAHSLPIAYSLGAARGLTPSPRAELIAYASPYRFDRGMLARCVEVLAGWLAVPDW